MNKLLPVLLVSAWLGAAGDSAAQDLNITRPVEVLEQELGSEPFEIVAAEISRPKAKGDITLKAEVSFAGKPPYRVKLRKAEPGAEDFNNRPRYDIAAYELQKIFLDPAEYVVPPTAARMVPLEEFRKYSPDVRPTFRGSDDVLGVLQYWLQEVAVIADVYDAGRFASDPVYARHIGQLNIFTFLIEHGDSNVGNFLISRRSVSIDSFRIACSSADSSSRRACQTGPKEPSPPPPPGDEAVYSLVPGDSRAAIRRRCFGPRSWRLAPRVWPAARC